LVDVVGEFSVVGRERALWDAEQGGKEPAICKIPLPHIVGKRSEEQIVRDNRAIDQRGVNPAKRRDIVGAVGGAGFERTNRRFRVPVTRE
jgi:hypothetical protein